MFHFIDALGKFTFHESKIIELSMEVITNKHPGVIDGKSMDSYQTWFHKQARTSFHGEFGGNEMIKKKMHEHFHIMSECKHDAGVCDCMPSRQHHCDSWLGPVLLSPL